MTNSLARTMVIGASAIALVCALETSAFAQTVVVSDTDDITIDNDDPITMPADTMQFGTSGPTLRVGLGAHTRTGDITIVNDGVITLGDADAGIYATTSNGGNITVTNNADITMTGAGGTGIGVRHSRSGGDDEGLITITNTADIVANGGGANTWAINAFSEAGGGINIVNSGDLTGGGDANLSGVINAQNAIGGGPINIDTTGTLTMTGAGAAIRAIADGGDVNVTFDGVVRGARSSDFDRAIFINASGNVTLNASGRFDDGYGAAIISRGGTITANLNLIATGDLSFNSNSGGGTTVTVAQGSDLGAMYFFGSTASVTNSGAVRQINVPRFRNGPNRELGNIAMSIVNQASGVLGSTTVSDPARPGAVNVTTNRGDTTLDNYGRIVDDLLFGIGNDRVLMRSGSVMSGTDLEVRLGNGNDIFIIENGAQIDADVYGGDGTDGIELRGGTGTNTVDLSRFFEFESVALDANVWAFDSTSSLPLFVLNGSTLRGQSGTLVTVAAPTTLQGFGTIDGALSLLGNLSLGSPGGSTFGLLRVNEDLTIGSGSTLIFDFSNTEQDLIQVLGNLVIQSGAGLDVNLLNGATYSDGMTRDIIQMLSGGTITGASNFIVTLNGGAGFTGTTSVFGNGALGLTVRSDMPPPPPPTTSDKVKVTTSDDISITNSDAVNTLETVMSPNTNLSISTVVGGLSQSGDVAITNRGAVTANSSSAFLVHGIYAETAGDSTLSITNEADISANSQAGAFGGTGIGIRARAEDGNIFISTSGTINASGRTTQAIQASTTGSGDISIINRGALNSNSNEVFQINDVIQAVASGTGDISIDTVGTLSLNGTGDGISARTESGDIDIVFDGAIQSRLSGGIESQGVDAVTQSGNITANLTGIFNSHGFNLFSDSGTVDASINLTSSALHEVAGRTINLDIGSASDLGQISLRPRGGDTTVSNSGNVDTFLLFGDQGNFEIVNAASGVLGSQQTPNFQRTNIAINGQAITSTDTSITVRNAGLIQNEVFLGLGRDAFYAMSGSIVTGLDGFNNIRLLQGNDLFVHQSGATINSFILGGDGTDTYRLEDGNGFSIVDLDRIRQFEVLEIASGLWETDGTATFDTINLNGGAFRVASGDTIVTTAGGLFTVGTDAILEGAGTIRSDLLLNGTLAPGDGGFGVMIIDRDLTIGSGSTLIFDYSDSDQDFVQVGGNLIVESGAQLDVNLFDGATYADGQTREVIQMTGGGSITGASNFDVTLNGTSDFTGATSVFDSGALGLTVSSNAAPPPPPPPPVVTPEPPQVGGGDDGGGGGAAVIAGVAAGAAIIWVLSQNNALDFIDAPTVNLWNRGATTDPLGGTAGSSVSAFATGGETGNLTASAAGLGTNPALTQTGLTRTYSLVGGEIAWGRLAFGADFALADQIDQSAGAARSQASALQTRSLGHALYTRLDLGFGQSAVAGLSAARDDETLRNFAFGTQEGISRRALSEDRRHLSLSGRYDLGPALLRTRLGLRETDQALGAFGRQGARTSHSQVWSAGAELSSRFELPVGQMQAVIGAGLDDIDRMSDYGAFGVRDEGQTRHITAAARWAVDGRSSAQLTLRHQTGRWIDPVNFTFEPAPAITASLNLKADF
ncbi:beta strand repeat-containing protein [Algimonas porphyrae]|uniref:Autotransporter domain-containing protein n=1 Tax=Algimonas porphyrae TaxID=1128113 RepID=A0ABQ5V2K7_9PROT|nr:hypothetical protein [Algimonas porphyrae]GLQ20826.1 hypothetical protein GCM10007854_17810 [Algimonas porphyrae]